VDDHVQGWLSGRAEGPPVRIFECRSAGGKKEKEAVFEEGAGWPSFPKGGRKRRWRRWPNAKVEEDRKSARAGAVVVVGSRQTE